MDISVLVSLLSCAYISGMPACLVRGCQFDRQRLASSEWPLSKYCTRCDLHAAETFHTL